MLLMKEILVKAMFLFAGIAAELTGALESSVKGQAVDLKATLNNCTKIFPDLFAQSIRTESQADVSGLSWGIDQI